MINCTIIGLIIWIIKLVFALNATSNLCPVSINEKIVLPYPDIYVNEDFLRSRQNATSYPCKSFHNKKEKLILSYPNQTIVNEHNCIDNYCPVTERNINISGSIPNWPVDTHALCKLHSHLGGYVKERFKINVIVFGGSMPLGKNIIGRCCLDYSSTTDKCVQYKLDPRAQQLAEVEFRDQLITCNWFNYVARWMRNEYPSVSFSFYNLAIGGYSSMEMAKNLAEILISRNITISQDDIILLDHSCNDGFSPFESLELLVREVIRSSVNASPSIIIMEQWMHTRAAVRGYKFPRGEPTAGYVGRYRTIAEHYKTMYFSYNEVLWDTKDITDPKRLDLLDILKAYDFHPPWHSHKFIADIMAGYLLKEIQDRCGKTDSLKIWNDKLNLIAPYNSECISMERRMCDVKYSMPLYAVPASKFIPPDVSGFELSLTGWTQYIDHNDVPGWIINAHAPLTNRTLNFTFWNDNIMNMSKTHHIQYSLQYLRTYQNAGRIVTFICGHLKDRLDALWLHHTVTKLSIPQTFSRVLLPHHLKACTLLPVADRVLSIVFNYVDNAGHVNAKGYCKGNEEARSSNKFKLLRAQVCYTIK